jgi:DNA-binding response OmpR family regulator
MNHLLVIEDEKKVAEALEEGLQRSGFNVDVAYNGEEGFYLLNTHTYDLLVLDLMLPGHSGYDILRTLRDKGIRLPVLILSARDSTEDKVTGLDMGADDYLGKPFAFPELLARIRVLLRRGKNETVTHLSLADLEMDLVHHTVKRNEQTIPLTNREFDLLRYLLENKEQIVSREMLARHVWEVVNRVTPIDNLIDVHITRLRHKIDEPFEPKLLHTVRGVGFILSDKGNKHGPE